MAPKLLINWSLNHIRRLTVRIIIRRTWVTRRVQVLVLLHFEAISFRIEYRLSF